MHTLLYSLLIWCVLVTNCLVSCIFYPEELKAINYDVDISKTPVKVDEEQPYPVLHLKSKYGQKYQCILPLINEGESTEKKETTSDENTDIKELLKPMETGSCKIKTKGWWTYEFCAGRHIKQYHIEDGKIIGQVNILGLYQSDYDWNNETDENKFQHAKQRYHSQFYSNGSRCDLTGLPRSAEVRFICVEDAVDYIYRVDEPGTCAYLLTVHTSRICSHPKLKPLPFTKPHTISCKPLLNEKQYALYLQKIEKEKSIAENKRNKLPPDQNEELQIMKSWTKLDDSDVQNNNFEKFQTLVDGDSRSATENLILDDESIVESPEQLQSVDEKLNTEKNEDVIEKMLWKEYDEEIEKLKTIIPPEKFSSVKDDIQKHIDSVINEAEEELDVNLHGESKYAAFIKLTSTLHTLLDKLEKAEKEVAEATKELEKVQSVITSKSNGKVKLLEEEDESKTAMFDDDKLHVRIRRLDKKSPDSTGELHEMDFTQRKQLEQAVKERLEKSGLDTGGRRIEVRIITAGYYDNEDGKDFHSLSDDETNQFQNMIMALLTGQQEAIQEMERHKKLEENYRFVWNSNEQLLTDDDDE